MNYIVFDLEWNQSPYGKEGENKHLPFEIIEIGAVKLDADREICDTFHTYVRPKIYRKFHYMTQEVVGLTMDDLKDGLPFPKAGKAFLDFCGPDCRFATWGTQDLLELQRNFAFYHMKTGFDMPLFYEDVQKLFAITYETRAERRALSYAADYLKLAPQGDFHHALDDALYTARVLMTIPSEIVRTCTSIDYFRTPRKRSEEFTIRYPSYEKMVSRRFNSRDDILQDPELLGLHCETCGRPLRRRINWYQTGGRVWQAAGRCPDDGYVKSKIRVKKAEGGGFFAVKTTKMIGPARYETLKERCQSKTGKVKSDKK